jgi:hypothetical protein
MTTTITRRRLKARDIPASWQVELPADPETPVEVTIVPVDEAGRRSPRQFLGAGRGLFRSATDADAHLRRQRDAWEG